MTTTDPRPNVRPRLASVSIRGFRTLEEVDFRPGPLSALVGESGAGKSNLLAAVHDRGAPRGSAPILAEKQLNNLIRTTMGKERAIELTPDFEGIAGLHGHSHKPARAWRYFKSLSPADVPRPLAHMVELAVAAAREPTKQSVLTRGATS
jgi:ABC-type cobalamin/Fe3+-siderophores transport system ATPase subunit